MFRRVPGRIRTSGLWSRSPTLYPAELRVHNVARSAVNEINPRFISFRGLADFSKIPAGIFGRKIRKEAILFSGLASSPAKKSLLAPAKPVLRNTVQRTAPSEPPLFVSYALNNYTPPCRAMQAFYVNPLRKRWSRRRRRRPRPHSEIPRFSSWGSSRCTRTGRWCSA